MTRMILNVEQSVLLAKIKQVLMDYRAGGSIDDKARDILEAVLSSTPVPARDLRECVICGEQVTVSNATQEWENRHGHGSTPVVSTVTA